MPSRVIKLLTFLVIVGIVSYIYVQNPNPVTVTFSDSRSWTAPLALVLTVTFLLGIILTAVTALYYGARSAFHRWLEKRKIQTEREHWDRIQRVREFIASGALDRACTGLQRIVEENPENVLARVMYVECLQKLNHSDEALEMLDRARAQFTTNIELPLTAANVYLHRGNATAAFDNAQLVLQTDPENRAALRIAKICAERLGNFSKAAEVTERLLRGADSNEVAELELALATLQLKTIVESSGPDKRKQLEALTKQQRSFVPAFEALAVEEEAHGNNEAAARLHAKAFAIDKHTGHLNSLAQIWLKAHDPARAVSSVRGVLLNETDLPLEAQVFFIQLLLHLEMIDEAKKEVDSLQRKIDSAGTASDAVRRELALARTRILERHDQIEVALDTLLSEMTTSSNDPFLRNRVAAQTPLLKERGAEAPSPQLSTP